jgi:hypothetical protein
MHERHAHQSPGIGEPRVLETHCPEKSSEDLRDKMNIIYCTANFFLLKSKLKRYYSIHLGMENNKVI